MEIFFIIHSIIGIINRLVRPVTSEFCGGGGGVEFGNTRNSRAEPERGGGYGGTPPEILKIWTL